MTGRAHRAGRSDDLIQPFKIEGQAIRGRLVRLGPLVDADARAAIDYPGRSRRMLARDAGAGGALGGDAEV